MIGYEKTKQFDLLRLGLNFNNIDENFNNIRDDGCLLISDLIERNSNIQILSLGLE